jgi:hypothetical protein
MDEHYMNFIHDDVGNDVKHDAGDVIHDINIIIMSLHGPRFHEHIFICQKWYQNVETDGALLQVIENYGLMVSSTTNEIVGLNDSKNFNAKLEQTYIRFILAH